MWNKIDNKENWKLDNTPVEEIEKQEEWKQGNEEK